MNEWKETGDGGLALALPRGNVTLDICPVKPQNQEIVGAVPKRCFVAVKERGELLFGDNIIHVGEDAAKAHADTLLWRHWAGLAALDIFSDPDNQPDPPAEFSVWEWADVPNPREGGQASVAAMDRGYVAFEIKLERGKYYVDIMTGSVRLVRDKTSHKTLDAAKARASVVYGSNFAILNLLDRSVPVPGKKAPRKRTRKQSPATAKASEKEPADPEVDPTA